MLVSALKNAAICCCVKPYETVGVHSNPNCPSGGTGFGSGAAIGCVINTSASSCGRPLVASGGGQSLVVWICCDAVVITSM